MQENEDIMSQFGEEVSTKEFDEAVKQLSILREDYDIKKAISSEANALLEAQEEKVLALLTKSGKTKYILDNVGTVTKAVKYSVRVPQSLDEKQKMIDYFNSSDPMTKLKYLTVNSMSLNSYINEMREHDPSFMVPGIAEPTANEQLRFTKKK